MCVCLVGAWLLSAVVENVRSREEKRVCSPGLALLLLFFHSLPANFLCQVTSENHTEKDPMDTELTETPASVEPTSESPAAPDKTVTEPQDVSKPPADASKPSRRQQRGYECKYCTFSTQNLNTFKEHVDAKHPNVILNPLYLCAVCNFNTKKFDSLTVHNERCHPGEINFKFKRIKLNNQTILEQTIEGCSNNTSGKGEDQGKPTAVRVGKPKVVSSDNKRTDSQLCKLPLDLAKKPITAVNVNGTVIIPESTLFKADSVSHIMPSLQRPVNYTQVRREGGGGVRRLGGR